MAKWPYVLWFTQAKASKESGVIDWTKFWKKLIWAHHQNVEPLEAAATNNTRGVCTEVAKYSKQKTQIQI